MIKKTYENPESEMFVVRFEENIMSPTTGEAGEKNTYNEYEEDF